jgi:hypothetical protein
MAERAKQQREIQFPNYPDKLLWHRTLNDGYSTIPRTLPLAMQCIDAQSKGQPAGHTLLCLWIRAPDYPFLTIEAPATFAAEAGFVGERAVDTWRRRMRTLRDLGFIEAKKGPTGDFHYVLLLNPNIGIEKQNRQGKVQTVLYGRFRDRLIDIGAQRDITDYDAYLDEVKKSEAKAATKAAKTAKDPVDSSVATVPEAKSNNVPSKPKPKARSKLKEV